jgi:hypothetical protein
MVFVAELFRRMKRQAVLESPVRSAANGLLGVSAISIGASLGLILLYGLGTRLQNSTIDALVRIPACLTFAWPMTHLIARYGLGWASALLLGTCARAADFRSPIARLPILAVVLGFSAVGLDRLANRVRILGFDMVFSSKHDEVEVGKYETDLGSTSSRVRIQAAMQLLFRGRSVPEEIIRSEISSRDLDVRNNALVLLGLVGGRDDLSLLEALSKKNGPSRGSASCGLLRLRTKLANSDEERRDILAAGFNLNDTYTGNMPECASEEIIRRYQSGEHYVREAALKAAETASGPGQFTAASTAEYLGAL